VIPRFVAGYPIGGYGPRKDTSIRFW